MPAPPKIIELVAKFERNIESYKAGKYNETQLRREFLDPFFKELGWDIDNELGYAELYKDVVHEDALKIGNSTTAPDYSFRIGGQRKFFVEAKKPSVNIKDDIAPSFQIRRYAWTAKLPLSILTDFEEFAVFDCRIKPDKSDKASKGRIHYYNFKEYAHKWDEIAGIFSKQAILEGAFDKYAAKGKKRGTQEVDDEFLQEIEHWRELLARNIAIQNQGISQRELNFAVQRTIDRIIFLRICEDRGIEIEEQLKLAAKSKTGVYEALKALFLKADDRYNSGLFHFRKEKGRSSEHDDFTLSLTITDTPLKEIIEHLYYPESPYEFSVLPADILGQVYERFLGKVIQLKGRSAIIEEKPEVKKAGGVFYTPTYIVDYIIENTLTQLLEGKTPEQVSTIRVLDPACGSGTFLIQAYQHLLDWHLAWYLEDEEKHLQKRVQREQTDIQKGRSAHKAKHTDKVIQTRGEWQLSFSERLRILKNNIYGVDIDSQAIETTKLSLLLKLLEVKQHQLPITQRLLPDLDTNIKCGNSLIGTDFYQSTQLTLLTTEDQYKINAFDWETAFPEIFKDGGFDVVIGNPPYIFSRGKGFTEEEKNYFSKQFKHQKYQLNTYSLFTEKSYLLLKTKGILGFIIPNSWLTIDTFSSYRAFIRKEGKNIKIVNFLYQVFQDAKIDTSILIFEKGPSNGMTLYESPKQEEIYFIAQFKTATKAQEDPINFKNTNPAHLEILNKIENSSKKLGDFSTIRNGLKAYEIRKGDPPQTREMKEKNIYFNKEKIDETYKPFLEGKMVKRYQLEKHIEYLKYGRNLAAKRDENIFKSPRILIRQIPSSFPHCFDAMYIEEYFLNEQSVNNVYNFKHYSPLFLLAVLNSKLISFWFVQKLDKFQRKTFPRILKKEVELIPIPKPTQVLPEIHHKINDLVSEMIEINKNVYFTDQEKRLCQQRETLLNQQIDQLVYEIYQLTPEEIALVEGFSA